MSSLRATLGVLALMALGACNFEFPSDEPAETPPPSDCEGEACLIDPAPLDPTTEPGSEPPAAANRRPDPPPPMPAPNDDPESICGNGQLEPGEACDNGGSDAQDGCSDRCTVEPGYACEGARCVPCSGAPFATCVTLEANFGEGVGSARFGMSPEQLGTGLLPSPVLELAPEYRTTPVSYANGLLAGLDGSFPSPTTAHVTLLFTGAPPSGNGGNGGGRGPGGGGGGGGDDDDESNRLFRISVRYNSGGEAAVREFAEARNIPISPMEGGAYFRVETARVVVSGGTNWPACAVPNQPCIEISRRGSPTFSNELSP